MRCLLFSLVVVSLACGGATEQTAPAPPEPIEPTPVAQPAKEPAVAQPMPPGDWEEHDATSDDGTVTVRFWLPKESDGMVFYDAGWNPGDNRYELVGELRGNHLRFWELKASADEDFNGVIETMIEDEGAEQLGDEIIGEWRHVRFKERDGATPTMVRRGRIVCMGATATPDALSTLVRVCELISIERK